MTYPASHSTEESEFWHGYDACKEKPSEIPSKAISAYTFTPAKEYLPRINIVV